MIRNGLLVVGALLLVAAPVGAQSFVVDLTAQHTTGTNCGGGCTYSYDEEDHLGNDYLSIDIGADRWVVQIDWADVMGIYADAAYTWGSEMYISMGSTSSPAVYFNPFYLTSSTCPDTGCGPESGSVDLVDAGLAFQVDADGLLQIQFFESYDDISDTLDAVFTAGTVTFDTSDIYPVPNLTLSKTAAAGVYPGQNLTYTITYGNDGGVDATNAVVTDTVPAGTHFVSATGGGTEAGRVVTWNVGDLTAGTTGLTVDMTVFVTADTGTIMNDTYAIVGDDLSPVAGPTVYTAVDVVPVPGLNKTVTILLGLLVLLSGAVFIRRMTN